MKIELAKEEGGNLAYKLMWINCYNGLSIMTYDTKKEVLKQYNYLKTLNKNYKYIAIYRRCEIIGDEE